MTAGNWMTVVCRSKSCFRTKRAGNAGLILKVDRPSVGAHNFSGYEVALYPDTGSLLLGRRPQNRERRNEDGTVQGLQVLKSNARSLLTTLKITGFDIAGRSVRISQIAGHLDECNTGADPERIVPHSRVWRPVVDQDEVTYLVPPDSFSVLRFE
jgi:hypothetical protein